MRLGDDLGGGRAADGERGAQLLDRLGVAEREHGGLPLAGDRLDGELDRALLVGTHREAGATPVHGLAVLGEDDLLGAVGDPLHADKNVRHRSRSFAGSSSGVASTDRTVTG